MTTTIDVDEILSAAAAAVEASGGRLRLAKNERDDTRDPDPEAAEHFKLDETRLGRDLRVYNFMAKVMGWAAALSYLLTEVVIPITKAVPASGTVLWVHLDQWAERVMPADHLAAWNELLLELKARP